MRKHYGSLRVERAFDENDARVIEGFASTADVDRMGDIVEPSGVNFRVPTPLLWQHDSRLPVGIVEKITPTKTGVKFRARLPFVDQPPGLKNRIDEAWASIKAGLIHAVSIGFRVLEDSRIENGGWRILRWDMLELSLVTVPANPAATITQIREFHETRGLPAASGDAPQFHGVRANKAGVTAKYATDNKDSGKMNIAEMIKALEDKIKRANAKSEEIQSKASAEGRTKSADEKADFDEALDEVETLKSELADMKRMEASQIVNAKPVRANDDFEGSESRGAAALGRNEASREKGIRFADERAPKGLRFAQAIKCITIAKLTGVSASELATEQYSYDPRVAQVVKGVLTKAAVAGAVPTSAGWAGNIAPTMDAMGEFIEYLWPTTIIGRLQGVVPMPFGYRVPREATPAGAAWVGAGKPVPVSAPIWDNVTINRTKVAGLLVASKENLRFASVNADTLFRNDLAGALQKLLDEDFVDPANAGSANLKPASITNGLTAVAPSGTDVTALRADLQKLLAPLVIANLGLAGVSIIMREDMALAISMMVNALEQPAFPDVSAAGGTLPGGLRILTSNAVKPGDLIACHAPSIALAKDDAIEIEVSGEASLQMDDAPTNDASTGTGSSMVSMFQTDSFAFRACVFANWIKTRSAAVSYIGVGAYGGAASA